ncbi:hypothetical protein ABZ646_27555 [Streptomyces sp. NPDC007162]|uniref:hypothetical protein n=1 Tax=Streptomyces sp. NPDC007162 TaxID=3156917 RepID=UPI0033DE056D
MPATALTGVADGDRYDFTWTPSTSADVDHHELRGGLWHEATPDRNAWFLEYTGVDVPADGTQLSAEESPRVHMQPPVSTSTA